MRFRLVPLEGGPPVDLVKELVVVGRKDECDLRIDHKSVSKMHCILVRTDGLLFLRDLGSTNGTRVNGTRVRRAALLPNDQLHIAGVRYTLQVAVDAPPVPPRDEHTIRVDRRSRPEDDDDLPGEIDSSSSEEDAPLVKANALPDHYEDGK